MKFTGSCLCAGYVLSAAAQSAYLGIAHDDWTGALLSAVTTSLVGLLGAGAYHLAHQTTKHL